VHGISSRLPLEAQTSEMENSAEFRQRFEYAAGELRIDRIIYIVKGSS